jgi:hypothetical protein
MKPEEEYEERDCSHLVKYKKKIGLIPNSESIYSKELEEDDPISIHN